MSANVIQDFMSKLSAGNRPDVFLSVTPGIGLEMIRVDQASRTVKNYGLRPLAYNESLREIGNMEEFKTAVSELFEELNISPKCNVTVNLPTVLFGSIDMSLMLGDEAITGAITSEVEQSYVFKRHDPVVQWWDSNTGSGETRKLFYSAVQQLVVENISNALTELGAVLVGVEMSLASHLRALDFSGLAASQMRDNVGWNLLTVNSNGYTLVSLVGKQVIDYYEEPIAVKSYEGDEIYNVISSSAQITLMSYPATQLLVVSDTSAVSAEILAKNLNIDYQIEYVENNKFKRKAFLPVSLDVLPDNEIKVSLQAIGVAISKFSDFPISCNFMATSSGEVAAAEEVVKIPIGEKEYAITPTAAMILALLVGGILAAAAAVPSFLLLPNMLAQKQASLDELNASISQVEKQIEDLKKEQQIADKFNIKAAINNVIQNNRVKLMSYTALGQSVPPELWLTSFSTSGNGQILITGGASSVEDVYLFFKNMKDALVGSNLQLKKLEMVSDVEDELMSNLPVTYDFEISNMKDAPPPVDDKGKGSKSGGKTTGQAANVAPEKKLLSDKPIN